MEYRGLLWDVKVIMGCRGLLWGVEGGVIGGSGG